MNDKRIDGKIKEEKTPFWTTIPGILTGIAALITAIGGFILVLSQLQKPTPIPTPTAKESTSVPQPQITPFPNKSGDKVFFSRNNDYYMMSLDGTYQIRIIKNPEAYIQRPSITSDGENLLFTSNIEGHTDIYTINRDGSNLRNITNSIGYDEILGSWKPDNKQILFYRQYSTTSDILIIDADGKNETNVTNSFIGDFGAMNTITEMAWAPDGKKFVFQSDQEGDYNVYICDLSSKQTYKVTNNKTDDYKAAWSPDGTKIVYTSVIKGNNTDIFVIDVTNLSLLPAIGINITNHPAHDTEGLWSPDGKQIVFVSDRDGNGEIYVMDIDGKNIRKITNTPENENYPRWIK
jgi:TolB protein